MQPITIFQVAIISAVLLIAGCNKGSSTTVKNQATVVGGDRDNNGCIPSAGYRWCAKLKQCVRPWELAAEQGFDNTSEEFAAFCDTE
jgi:hypothetical protein